MEVAHGGPLSTRVLDELGWAGLLCFVRLPERIKMIKISHLC